MKYCINFIYLLAFIIVPRFSLSQSYTIKDRYGVSWNRYYLSWDFRPGWALHQEADYRFLTHTGAWHQLVFHTHLHWRWHSNADAAFGVTRMENGALEPSTLPHPRRIEWRLFQEMNLSTPIFRTLVAHHRYRIEQRFIPNLEVPFVWRGRYKLQLNWTLPGAKWTVHVFDEILLNWGKGTPGIFDQNRLYAGLSHAFSEHIRAEVGYMAQWQQAGRPDQLFLRDIVRASLYHHL